jgi:hypothetical protein
VYSALLSDPSVAPWRRYERQVDYVALAATTKSQRTSEQWAECLARPALPDLPSVQAELLASFARRQDTTLQLQSQFSAVVPVRLVLPAEINAWEKAGAFWTEFWAVHRRSGGLWEVSPVGYSPDGHRALVYYELKTCGWQGVGGLALLEYQAQGWQVESHHLLW